MGDLTFSERCRDVVQIPSRLEMSTAVGSASVWGRSRIAATHGGAMSLACPKCGKRFAFRNSLNRHRWKCEGTRRFSCELCAYVAFRTDVLRHHMQNQHGMKMWFLVMVISVNFPAMLRLHLLDSPLQKATASNHRPPEFSDTKTRNTVTFEPSLCSEGMCPWSTWAHHPDSKIEKRN